MKRLYLIIILLSSNCIFSEQINYSPTDIYIRVLENYPVQNAINIISEEYEVDNYFYLKDPKQSILKSNFRLNTHNLKVVEAEKPLMRTIRISLKNKSNTKSIAKLINKYEFVEIAEPVVYPKLLSASDFNDPNKDFQLMLSQIRAYQAWEIEDGDEEIVIGISDDGLRVNHPDLAPNTKSFTSEIPNNNIDDDNNGYIDDYNGFNLDGINSGRWGDASTSGTHGTRVAGIIGAKPNNGEGIIGIGNKCKIFPIKVSYDNDANSIPYAMESIIFAADRGIDILNCSWGSPKEFSFVEKSVIDYALAKGLVIVASAGNTGVNSLSLDRVKKWYPAGYSGVLGVGSVSPGDIPLDENSLGSHLEILAPGEDAYTTTFDNGYTSDITGTSFAAPVISGAAGIVKAKYPDLSPKELIHFIRQMGLQKSFADNIQQLMPKRIDLLNAVSTDPFSIPGFEILEITTEKEISPSIFENQRYEIGDQYTLKIKLKNHLGAYDNLKFKLSTAYDFIGNSIEIIESEFDLEKIERGQEVTISFLVKSTSFNNILNIMRLDIGGSNNYSDFLKFDFIPNSDITTFENNSYKISIGDGGNLGYNNINLNTRIGSGLSSKEFGNPLFIGGLAINIGNFTASSHSGNPLKGGNDFTVIKPFTSPNNDSSYFENQNNPNEFQIGISQKVELSDDEESWYKLTYEIFPKSEIPDLGIGFYMDLDVGRGEDAYLTDRTISMFDFIPTGLEAPTVGGIGAYNPNEEKYFGLFVFTRNSSPRGFGAGFREADFSAGSINKENIIALSQSSFQFLTDQPADIGTAAGLYYQNGLETNENPICEFCFASAGSLEELQENIQDCFESGISSVESHKTRKNNFYISDNKLFSLNYSGKIQLQIIDLHGRIFEDSAFQITKNSFVNLPQLTGGLYLIKINSGNQQEILKLIISN